MGYYEVWPASQRYHKNEALTYESSETLSTGQVVEVPLQRSKVLGFVGSRLSRAPSFPVKSILRVFPDLQLPTTSLELFHWLRQYYPAPSGLVSGLFLPKELPQKISIPEPIKLRHAETNLPPLTEAQQRITDELSNTSQTALLHGDTGTGKTRIYAALAKQQLANGKSVVILTPEIGLTPQLAHYFQEHFGEQVTIAHSQLTPAVRRQIWLSVATDTSPRIIIGPRSSLFLPISSLGLIVVDEAHDGSYKQDQAPHYQATRVAAKLANAHGALCLLGTATPLIDDYHRLAQHGNPIFRLTEPVHATIKPPQITLVDRNNKDEFTQSFLCSNTLITEIANTKTRGLSSLVFLNRRGTARQIVCQTCGWIATCPHCDIPLTFHHDSHRLVCHTCNHQQAVPTSCQDCGGTELLFKIAGTKALVQELERLFPGYRIKKFDSDDSKSEQLHTQYQALKEGAFDIVVGTQMITKGLDLPKLGLVGVPYADTSLYLPDYTADEHTYQLLSQVLGRVGRTTKQTSVVIQSFQPEHPSLQGAIHKDWDTFYAAQLQERKQFNYPPFTYLLKLHISRKTDDGAKQAAQKLAATLTKTHPKVEILPASPRFYHKTHGNYHWQIIAKAQDRTKLLKIIADLPSGWRYDIDPVSLL